MCALYGFKQISVTVDNIRVKLLKQKHFDIQNLSIIMPTIIANNIVRLGSLSLSEHFQLDENRRTLKRCNVSPTFDIY